LQAGKLEQARELFERAIRLEPDAFWPHFHLTLCAYRLERFDEALRSACVCVALSPKRAECFFNRGLCLQAVGETEAALQDYSRAIELDPGLGAASFQLGILLADVGLRSEALENLIRSAELGFEPARVHYQMALVQIKQDDWAAARKSIAESLEHDPNYAPALSLENRLKTQAAPTAQSRQ
jgi:tetratricopeptide (TPR) repeat protein